MRISCTGAASFRCAAACWCVPGDAVYGTVLMQVHPTLAYRSVKYLPHMLHLRWGLAIPRLPLHRSACERPPDVPIPEVLRACSRPSLPRRALQLCVAAAHLLAIRGVLPDAALLLACGMHRCHLSLKHDTSTLHPARGSLRLSYNIHVTHQSFQHMIILRRNLLSKQEWHLHPALAESRCFGRAARGTGSPSCCAGSPLSVCAGRPGAAHPPSRSAPARQKCSGPPNYLTLSLH